MLIGNSEMENIKKIIEDGARNSMNIKEFIAQQISEFKNSEQYKTMQIGSRYYKNNGDIKNKQRTYIDDEGNERIAPHMKNFKLNHPFLYKLTNQKNGYLLRKKPLIKQVISPNEKEDKEYEKILQKIFDNKMHRRLKYTLIETIKRGLAWWQLFVDETGELKTKLRYASRVIALWKDEEHETLDAIIMFYEIEEYKSATNKVTRIKVEFHDNEGVRYYIYDGASLILDNVEMERNQALLIKESDSDPVYAHFLINEQPYKWKSGIPFIYFKYNSEELPLIYFLKELVDCYDELTSKLGDAIYDAPDGVDVVKNYDESAGRFKKNLATYNLVLLDDEGEYDRKNITINAEAYKIFIEQLRKDIYEGAAGVDTQSEKFGTNDSGVALKQLYADLDLDCSNIETEFKSSLQHYMNFRNEFLTLKTGNDYTNKETELIFNKSMTVNEKELIENCKSSIGMISEKTILSKHPFVNDINSELAQISKEKKQAEGSYDNIIKNKDGDMDE